MNRHLEWVLFGLNVLLRLSLTAWRLAPYRLPIGLAQAEAYEQFAAHGARQLVATWPLLAVTGLMATAAKTDTALNPTGTVVLASLLLLATLGALAIPHDLFRARARPYAVIVVLTVLDGMLAAKLWAWCVELLSSAAVSQVGTT